MEADESVSHMTIVASVSGTIEATAVTTVGQAVLAGQQLMQIVPEGAPLEITAYVLNTDAGFVEVGQPVTIKDRHLRLYAVWDHIGSHHQCRSRCHAW